MESQQSSPPQPVNIFVQCFSCEELFSTEAELTSHKENIMINPDLDNPEGDASSSNSGKWTRVESLLLIRTFGEKRADFENPKKTKQAFWQDVKKSSGLHFTWKQCKGRWNTMQTRWKQVKDHNRVSGNSAKSYEFADELEAAVGGKSNVNPEHLLESSAPGTSKSIGKLSKELLNSRSSSGEDDDEPKSSKKKRMTLPKKAELLTWLKENQKEESKLRKTEEASVERRHKENMEFMRDFLGVLKELIPKP